MRGELQQILRNIAVAQVRILPVSIGDITTDDMAAAMPEAREIFGENPDIPLDLREWACQRIAVNLIARNRGFDVERVIAVDEARRARLEAEARERRRTRRRGGDEYAGLSFERET